MIGDKDIEFVITAPRLHAKRMAFDNKVRQTHGVLTDIIHDSHEFVVIGSPYLTEFSGINDAIHVALTRALERGVQLYVVSSQKSMKIAKINQYKDYGVRLYEPGEPLLDESPLIGSHAKFCLGDGKSVYLGSANFTFPGVHKHLEMGIYSKGTVANHVNAFWRYLVENKFLVTVEL